MGIDLLLSFLIFALIVGLILWAIRYIGLPEPIYRVVVIVGVIIIIIWALSRLGFLI